MIIIHKAYIDVVSIFHSEINIFHVHSLGRGEQFYIRLLEDIFTMCHVLNWTTQSTAIFAIRRRSIFLQSGVYLSCFQEKQQET